MRCKNCNYENMIMSFLTVIGDEFKYRCPKCGLPITQKSGVSAREKV